MASYISDQVLKTTFTINSSELHKDINNVIKQKLSERIEGVCYEDGYIIPDSIQIIKRSPGKIVTHNKKSGIQYIITYRAKIISPNEGDQYEAIISNVSKMGAIAFVKLTEDGTDETSPLIIIIPKDYFTGSQWNIEDLNKGQKLLLK